MKNLSSLVHSYVFSKYFLSSVEHKEWIFKKYPGHSFPHNRSKRGLGLSRNAPKLQKKVVHATKVGYITSLLMTYDKFWWQKAKLVITDNLLFLLPSFLLLLWCFLSFCSLTALVPHFHYIEKSCQNILDKICSGLKNCSFKYYLYAIILIFLVSLIWKF